MSLRVRIVDRAWAWLSWLPVSIAAPLALVVIFVLAVGYLLFVPLRFWPEPGDGGGGPEMD